MDEEEKKQEEKIRNEIRGERGRKTRDGGGGMGKEVAGC